jgi:hypothetical protein
MVRVGVMPVGYSLGGVLLRQAGLTAMFWLMGLGMALAALAGLLDPQYRAVRMEEAKSPGLRLQPSDG